MTFAEQTDAALMTPESVAAYLQIPIQTIYTWRARGKGPSAIKVGRHLRYRRVDVERWLEEQATRRTA